MSWRCDPRLGFVPRPLSFNRKNQPPFCEDIMTKTRTRMPLPPRESCSLAQRLQAADDAWQDFMLAQKQLEEGKRMEDSVTVFITFSRFTHELVEDAKLRALLLKCFELHMRTNVRSLVSGMLQ
jgi:hypothetical protein